MGISPTPVRDALKRLVQEGFINVLPRYGYIVTPVTIASVAEVYELRRIIEEAAVRLVIARASGAQLKEIFENADFTYSYKKRGSYQEFLHQNTLFHLKIAEAAGNNRLTDLLSKLLDEMMRIFFLGLELRDSAEEMRREHLDLAEALIKRDEDQAVVIIHQQLEASQRRILEALGENQGSMQVRVVQDMLKMPPLP